MDQTWIAIVTVKTEMMVTVLVGCHSREEAAEALSRQMADQGVASFNVQSLNEVKEDGVAYSHLIPAY